MTISSRGSSPRSRATEKEYLHDSSTDPSSVVIHELGWDEDSDVMTLAPWRRSAMRFLVVTASVPIIIGFYVAKIQVKGLKEESFRDGGLSGPKLWLAWSIIGSDLLLAIPAVITTILLANTVHGRWRRRLRLLGDTVPTVDVIIATCNEPLDVVQDTIRAALSLDYPSHRYRVIVSDDGEDEPLRSWVHDLARANSSLKDGADIFYTSRCKTSRADFKAGNLNHAVMFSEASGGAEFIAGLDADMIPAKHWLRAATAHMVADQRLGVVCPSQNFYNFPENDPLNQSLWVAWRCRDIVRDMSGLAWNSGSGWIVRRRALRDIGGFPTDCLVEDVSSAILMLAKGWKSAYLPEALQFGLMPESYGAHLKQYTRWTIGHCQLALMMGFYLSPSKTRYLSPHQRLSGFLTGFVAFAGPLLQMVQLFATFAGLLAGVPFLHAGSDERLRLLLRLQCGLILATWVHKLHLSIITGYQINIRQLGDVDYMSPYYALSILRTFLLPSRYGGRATPFIPSGSLVSPLHERTPHLRAPLHRRLHHLIFHSGGLFHLAVVLLLPASAAYRTFSILQAHPAGRDRSIEFLTRVGWPHAHWFVTLLVYLTPFWYMVFPPSVKDREELLGRQEGDAGARYPTKDGKQARWCWWSEGWTGWGFHVVLVYTCLVASGSRFI